MAFIYDEQNICTKCKKVSIIGRFTPRNLQKDIAWCTCVDVNLGGPNKGYRRQCKAFEPKKQTKD